MKDKKRLRLTVIGDLHYKKGMYISTVADLQTIFASAVEEGSDLVVHTGDFCNDYNGSPELINLYTQNSPVPTLGVYGNHELECQNYMFTTTPKLCSAQGVVWGTPTGVIAPDGSIAYYYYDIGDFRIIGLDTNYSWCEKEHAWEHNRAWSWGWPEGNTLGNSLGPVQMMWFEMVLNDAADRGLHCIALSHNNCFGTWWSCPDSEEFSAVVREANAKKPLTFIAYISGHVHTDRHRMQNNIFEFDVAATRNAEWIPNGFDHYDESMTYPYTEYDAEGNALRTYDRPLCELGMAKNTWFTAEPIFGTVDIDLETGKVSVRGKKSEWIYGVARESFSHGTIHPYVTDGEYQYEL